MKVAWSDAALDDFDQLITYIAERNPAAADRVASIIDRTIRELGTMQTGRLGRVAGTYEKVVQGLPYIIAYTTADSPAAVVVLRVIHGARDWPAGKWPR